MDTERPRKHLNRMRRLTWLALLWEQALAAFWRTDCWILFFAALWLLQIPATLGPAGNAAALIVFLLGLAWLLRESFTAFHWPGRDAVDRRLEQDSRLPHRPLAHIEDRLANPEREPTRALWHHSKEQALAVLRKLRPSAPRPVLTAKDPAALRIFVLLLVVVGAVAAGPQWKERLAFGLFPFSVHWQDQVSDNIVLWITPPAYTKLPQITLQGSGSYDGTADLPAGSTIKMRVRGGIGTPVFIIGEKEIPLQRLDRTNWGIETESLPADVLQIRQLFLTRAKIPVRYIEDRPPTVSLKGEPEVTAKGALQFPLSVQDDYGVEDMTIRLSLDPSVADAPLGGPYSETRAVMTAPGAETDMTPVFDLSWHTWAGLPVIIDLRVQDHLDQGASLPPIHLTLPERAFFHPVAKSLVDLRKRLSWTPVATMPNATYELETLLGAPEDYRGDFVTFLSLRSMASRMEFDPGEKTAYAIIPQLWDTALRIEDGNLTIAARNLRDAQQALEKLLADPQTTDEQIAAAMDNLRAAMSEYFQELFRELQKQMAENNPQMIPPEMLGSTLNPDDLAAFLDQMQAEALSGDRDNARQLLSQLQRMMDGLNSSLGMEMPQEMQYMMESVAKLKELIEQQQSLLDETHRKTEDMRSSGVPAYPDFLPFDQELFEQWGSGAMPPPPQEPERTAPRTASPIDTSGEKDRQEELRRMLGQLMLDADEELGKIPENMQKAEQEMRLSGDGLGRDRPDLSAPHQQKAIEYLQESMQQMNQQLMVMMQQMTMLSFGMGPLDPLGRPFSQGDGPSLMPGSKVEVPDESERRRVQEILQILRQRSGDLSRPDYELEYYRRLMRQF